MNRLRYNQIVYIPKSDPVILYKKLDFDMKSPYRAFKYVVGKIYSVKKFNGNVHKSCVKGRIYSTPKNDLVKWRGTRFFKVYIWGKCILEPENKVGSKYLKIIKELEPKEFVEYVNSDQAYHYCLLIKDVKKIRNKIEFNRAFLYCKNIKDRKEMRDKIIDSYSAYCYCKWIKNRKEMRDKIVDSRLIQCIQDENAQSKRK